MSGRRERQKGSALLIVFVFAAIVAISLYMELPVAAFEAQRQKEELLMTRGNEYAHAVKLFVRKTGRYPASLKQLEDTNRMRFLRHDYADPLTGKKDWRLLHAGPGGVIIDSKVSNGILLPGMQPGGGTNGGGTPTSTAAFPNGNSGGSQSGFGSGSFASSGSSFGANNGSNQPAQSTGFSSASDQSASQPEVTVQQPRQRAPAVSANGSGQVVNPEAALEANAMALPPTTGDGQGAAGQNTVAGQNGNALGNPAAGVASADPANANANAQQLAAGNGNAGPGNSLKASMLGGTAGPAQVGQASGFASAQLGAIGSGGIAGVASKAGGHSIKRVNDQSNYSLWEFYYDPRKDVTPGGAQIGAYAQNGQQPGITGQNGQASTSGFGGSSFGQSSGNGSSFGQSSGNGSGFGQSSGTGSSFGQNGQTSGFGQSSGFGQGSNNAPSSEGHSSVTGDANQNQGNNTNQPGSNPP